MSGDYSRYDLREEDPYLQPNSSCLINLLSCTDTQDLNQAEAEISQIALADLVINPVEASFDLEHLKSIHQRIFAEIYPFAGQIRTVEISKNDQLFLPHSLIESFAASLFLELKTEQFLAGLEQNAFAERAGYYLSQINLMHAFREGNGRTQRVFIDQLVALHGWVIEWNAISA